MAVDEPAAAHGGNHGRITQRSQRSARGRTTSSCSRPRSSSSPTGSASFKRTRAPLLAVRRRRRGRLSAQPRDPAHEGADREPRGAAAVAAHGHQARGARRCGASGSARVAGRTIRRGRRGRWRRRTRDPRRPRGSERVRRTAEALGVAEAERDPVPDPEGARLLLRRDLAPHRVQLDQGQPLAHRGAAALLRALRRDRVGRPRATTSRPLLSAVCDGACGAEQTARLHARTCAACHGCRAALRDYRSAPAPAWPSCCRRRSCCLLLERGGLWSRLADWLPSDGGERAGALGVKLQQGAEVVSAQKAAAVVASTAAIAGGGAAVHQRGPRPPGSRSARRASSARRQSPRPPTPAPQVQRRPGAGSCRNSPTPVRLRERCREPRPAPAAEFSLEEAAASAGRSLGTAPSEFGAAASGGSTSTQRVRRRRWGVRPVRARGLIVVLVLAFVASAAPARAGIYEVYACGGAAGGAQNAFVASADANMSAYSICPPGSPVGTGIVTKATSSGGVAPYLAGAFQVFDAPAGADARERHLQRRRDPAARLLVGWHRRLRRRLQSRATTRTAATRGTPGCGIGTPVFSIRVTVHLYSHHAVPLRDPLRQPGRLRHLGERRSRPRTARCSPPRTSSCGCEDCVRCRRSSPHHGALWARRLASRPRGGLDDSYTDNVGIMVTRTLRGRRRSCRRQDYRDGSLAGLGALRLHPPAPVRRHRAGRARARHRERSRTEPIRCGRGRRRGRQRGARASARSRSTTMPPAEPDGVSARGRRGLAWRQRLRRSRGRTRPGRWRRSRAPTTALCRAEGRHMRRKVSARARASRRCGVAGPGPGGVHAARVAGGCRRQPRPRPRQRSGAPALRRLRRRRSTFEPLDPERPAARACVASRTRAPEWWTGRSRSAASATGHGRSLGAHRCEADASRRRVDDLALPDGIYELRAHVRDARRATSAPTTRRADGAPMRLTLPLRAASRIVTPGSVEVPEERRAAGRSGVHAGPRTACAATVRRSAASCARAVLSCGTRPLAVLARPARADRLRARRRCERTSPGASRSAPQSGPSRTLRFAMAGHAPRAARPDRRPRPDCRPLLDRRRPALRAERRQRSPSRARCAAGPVPDGGKLIDLQAYYRGRWRTFATPRTDAARPLVLSATASRPRAGSWSIASGPASGARRPIRMSSGHSRVVRVTVRRLAAICARCGADLAARDPIR